MFAVRCQQSSGRFFSGLLISCCNFYSSALLQNLSGVDTSASAQRAKGWVLCDKAAVRYHLLAEHGV